MEQVIKSIFCCAGGDSSSTDQQTSNNKPLNNNGSNSKNAPRNYNSNQNTSKQHNNKSTQPNSNSDNSKSKSNSKYMGDNDNNNGNKRSHRTTSHQHQSSKADVNVYEATDSTLETNDDGQQNYGTSNSVSDEQGYKSKADRDSSIDLGQESEIDQDQDMDDFFDLTKIQPGQAHASTGSLLEPIEPKFKGKKCLVLDLDETLVHSSFKVLRQCDFVIPVDIDNQLHNVFVIKRPGVDEFLKRVGELYEVVVFTASVSRYGDPLLDELDIHKSVHHRLFRDSCYNYQGNYIKNLSQMGRPLSDLIILDNSPASYIFHPQHAIPISSWFSDAHDNELLDIIPFLEDLAKDNVEDIGMVLDINL